MTQYEESLPQSVVNINQSSSNLCRGFYLVKRLDALTSVFTNRLSCLKKDLDHAKRCGDKEHYLSVGTQIIEIQSQLYGIVKEKIVVVRQLSEMIAINESKLVGDLEPDVDHAEKPQKGGSNDGLVSARIKKRVKENKIHCKGLSSGQATDNDSGNSSSALTSDSN